MFRVIVAGSRDFNDYQLLSCTMDRLLSMITDEITIVCGLARGADALGERYGKEHNYGIDYFPAKWSEYGKCAGYIRNEEMAKHADALIAFWDGKSKGTKHMIETAKKYSLKIRIKRYIKD